MPGQVKDTYVEEGVDALALITPLVEKRIQIIAGTVLISLAVGILALATPRKYKAELALTPVVSNRSTSALGGIAALAGATLQTGYQLTPARMVELLRSRTVLSGVGFSTMPGRRERVIDEVLDQRYTRNDPEEVAKHLGRLLTTSTNKETGTITVAVLYKDSALARVIAARIVDSASQIFVRTSKAQAQQLRIAQEGRVENAARQLADAEERLRQFNFGNRATPAFSVAGLERDRLSREIRFAEQIYTQAANDREAAFAQELQATPTVVVQDPLPNVLPKVRKRAILKTLIAALVSFVFLCFWFMLGDVIKRRLARSDGESDRFRRAIATLPRMRAVAPDVRKREQA